MYKLISFLATGLLFASPVLSNETYECHKASCDFESSSEAKLPTRVAPAPDFHEELARWIEALHANCNHPGPDFDKELARRLEALGANCDHPGPEFMVQLAVLLQSER